MTFPSSETDARTRWDDAFFAYVRQISPTPPTISSASPAFFNALRFARTLGPLPTPTDLAAAWRAAMAAVLAFDALPVREAALRTALIAIFSSRTLVASARLHQIADAFHAATFLITSGGGAITYG
jgi:hypothetical protein